MCTYIVCVQFCVKGEKDRMCICGGAHTLLVVSIVRRSPPTPWLFPQWTCWWRQVAWAPTGGGSPQHCNKQITAKLGYTGTQKCPGNVLHVVQMKLVATVYNIYLQESPTPPVVSVHRLRLFLVVSGTTQECKVQTTIMNSFLFGGGGGGGGVPPSRLQYVHWCVRGRDTWTCR
jgi:hypothetical protein